MIHYLHYRNVSRILWGVVQHEEGEQDAIKDAIYIGIRLISHHNRKN